MRQLAATLIPPVAIDRRAKTPIHRQVFDWYQRAIAEGHLQPGEGVPSSRELAVALGVSRVSVVNAYEQLAAEGYFETSVGIGTRVADSIPHASFANLPDQGRANSRRHDVSAAPRSVSDRASQWVQSPAQSWLKPMGAFRMNLPALDHFPVALWTKLLTRHSKAASRKTLAYGDAKGYQPLREAIAEYVRIARGVRCETSQVLITTGSQQALQIAAQALLNPKDRVCVEDPGYDGAVQVFKMAQAHIVPINVDSEGLVVSELSIKGRRARAVYTTPSHQYPMGMSMTAARRMQLLTWAATNGVWIIEDDYDSEYRFESRPIASLQGLDNDERVLYVGTFSKVLSPALRLGYLVLPRDLVAACEAARYRLDLSSPTLNQAAMADFIREGHFGRHLRRMRKLYEERRNVLVSALKGSFGSSIEILGSEAGLHLVVLLRQDIDDRRVAEQALEAGLSVMPLSSCRLRPGTRGGLVLGYGGVSPHGLRIAVDRLRTCISSVANLAHPQS